MVETIEMQILDENVRIATLRIPKREGREDKTLEAFRALAEVYCPTFNHGWDHIRMLEELVADGKTLVDGRQSQWFRCGPLQILIHS